MVYLHFYIAVERAPQLRRIVLTDLRRCIEDVRSRLGLLSLMLSRCLLIFMTAFEMRWLAAAGGRREGVDGGAVLMQVTMPLVEVIGGEIRRHTHFLYLLL